MLVSISVGIDRVHTRLLSYHKSKRLTPKVITGHYVITLRSAFGQPIEVGYSPFFLLRIMNSWWYTVFILIKAGLMYMQGLKYKPGVVQQNE